MKVRLDIYVFVHVQLYLEGSPNNYYYNLDSNPLHQLGYTMYIDEKIIIYYL